MKHSFVKLLACVGILAAFTACGSRKSQVYYDYKTQYIATELDGSYTVRSWGRARNAADAFQQAHKQAVYDVLFTGLTPASSNLRPVKALVLEVNARDKYADYFNAFFADGGAYTKFSSVKERRWSSSRWSRTESQSVCETTVCVFASELKKQLIEDGIIKQE